MSFSSLFWGILRPRKFICIPVATGLTRQSCAYCCNQNPSGNLLQCTSCRQIAYCSKECQVKAWPLHKVHCKQLSNVKQELTSTEPGLDVRKRTCCMLTLHCWFQLHKEIHRFKPKPLQLPFGHHYLAMEYVRITPPHLST